VVHPHAGAADQVVGGELPARRRERDAAIPRHARIRPGAADMHAEVGEARRAIPGVLRKGLPQAEHMRHEAPAPFIRHRVHVVQEGREGQPAIGLDELRLGPSAEQVDLRRAMLQSGRGVVEGRGPGAEHRHHLAAQPAEVDRRRAVVAAVGGQCGDAVGHPPAPASSCPVASTTLRASSGPALVSTERQGRPSSVRVGVIRPASTPLRTGTPVTRRSHSR
jgi:hypothetical protein